MKKGDLQLLWIKSQVIDGMRIALCSIDLPQDRKVSIFLVELDLLWCKMGKTKVSSAALSRRQRFLSNFINSLWCGTPKFPWHRNRSRKNLFLEKLFCIQGKNVNMHESLQSCGLVYLYAAFLAKTSAILFYSHIVLEARSWAKVQTRETASMVMYLIP